MIKTRRGLDLPIAGRPEQVIHDGPKVRSVAIIGFDYIGMKPTMHVKVGDRVKTGEIIFSDKKNDGVRFTAPATGVISAINRGAQRVLQSVVIDVEADEFVEFKTYSASELATLDREKVQVELVHSGLWTAFRTRPFSKTPHVGSVPNSIFVTAMDTHPLAADPAIVINEHKSDFVFGITALTRLTDGKVFVCKAAGSNIQVPEMSGVSVNDFAGPHPAGLAGTHIHFLDPVGAKKTVWSIGYQDVIAIGKLLTTGKLWTERVISLAGPQVEKPRLLRTRLGANIEELTAGQMLAGENRIISGSVLGGRAVRGALAFLGRFHNQVSVLKEGREREFMHYMRAGTNKFSTLGIYISQFAKSKLFNFDTSTNGSERAMVPVGSYEKVMPLDILPTQLLRYLLVGDTDMAQKLGALELDEEDLALCTYVCPGKYEYGPVLRDILARIEKEG